MPEVVRVQVETFKVTTFDRLLWVGIYRNKATFSGIFSSNLATQQQRRQHSFEFSLLSCRDWLNLAKFKRIRKQ